MNDVPDRLATDVREVFANLRASVRTDVELRVPGRSNQSLNLIPIAAAVVAAAGFAGVVLVVTSDDNDRAVTSSPTTVASTTTAAPAVPADVPNPGFLPAMVPEALDQHTVLELPPPEPGSLAADDPFPGTAMLLGRPSADGTSADGIVSVVLEPPKDFCCGDDMTVNGQPATLNLEDIEGSIATLSIEYETAFVILTGRMVETAPPLVDLAEAITVEGQSMEVAGALPAGYELLYTADGRLNAPAPLSLQYHSTQDADVALTVSFYNDPGENFQYRDFWGDTISTIELFGQKAFLAEAQLPDEEQGFVSVTWLARPDLMIRVSGFGISTEDLVATAASVTEIPDEEWIVFLDTANAPSTVPRTTVPPTTTAVPSST